METKHWLWFICAMLLVVLHSPLSEAVPAEQKHMDIISSVQLQSIFEIGNVAQDKTLAIVMERLAYYESSWIHNQWGDLHKHYPVFGIYQYQERTFKWLSRLAGFTHMVWQNKADQIKLTKWAITHGYGHLWGKQYKKAMYDALVRGVRS